MDHEKNGLGVFKWQSSGCLIDRMESRWYVWGKLNNYDTLIHSERIGGEMWRLVQFSDVWVTGHAGRAETRPRASNSIEFRTPWKIPPDTDVTRDHMHPRPSNWNIPFLTGPNEQLKFLLEVTTWQRQPKYLRWCARRRKVLTLASC